MNTATAAARRYFCGPCRCCPRRCAASAAPAAGDGGFGGSAGWSPMPTAFLTLSFQLGFPSVDCDCSGDCDWLARASATTSPNDLPASICFTTGRSGAACLSSSSFCCTCSLVGLSPPVADSASMFLSVTRLRPLS